MLSFDVVRSSAFHVLTLSTVAGVLFVGDMAQAALIHHYQAEGNADDSVGTHHGVEAGGVSYAPSVPNSDLDFDLDLGQAFSFNGQNNSNIDTNEASIPEGGDRTIAFWMKSNRDQSGFYNGQVLHVPLSQGHSAVGLTFQFGSFGALNLNYCCRTGGPASAIDQYPSDDLDWHHVAVTYNGDSFVNQMYLDGRPAEVFETTGGDPGELETFWVSEATSSGNTLRFGTDDRLPSRTFDGLLDDVRVYDEELGLDQISAIAGRIPPEPDIEIFWNIDGSGNWDNRTNWVGMPEDLGTPPNQPDQSAIFDIAITTPQTVFTNEDVTVNDVQFDNSATYTIAGGGTIHLTAGTKDGLPPSGVTVDQGSHAFQAAVELNNDVTVDIASGASLEFTNRLTLNGHTLTKTGGGSLLVNDSFSTGDGMIVSSSGVIGGVGTISGDVVNLSGTFAPGDSPGAGQVPEPSAGLLLLVGLLGLGAWRSRR